MGRYSKNGQLAWWLACAALMTACAGSATPAVSAPPSGQIPIASGGTLTASGGRGVTFTITLGTGVPAGEFAVVTPLPPAPPCSGTGCTAVNAPADGIQARIGPQPFDVSSMRAVAFTGLKTTNLVSIVLTDVGTPAAFTNFAPLAPSGGTLRITDPASASPVFTLVPDRLYTFAVYLTGIPTP